MYETSGKAMNGKPEEKPLRHPALRAGAVNMHMQNSTTECCNMTTRSPQPIPSFSSYYGFVHPQGSAYIIPVVNQMPFQDSPGQSSSFLLMQSPGHIMSSNLGQLIPLVPMQAVPIRGNFPPRAFSGPDAKEYDTSTNPFQTTTQTNVHFPLGMPLASSTFQSPSNQVIHSQSANSQRHELQSQGRFGPISNLNGSTQFRQSPSPGAIRNESPESMLPERTLRLQRPVSPHSMSTSPSSSSQQSRPVSQSSVRSLSPACSAPCTQSQRVFPSNVPQTQPKNPVQSTVRQTPPSNLFPPYSPQTQPAYPTLSTLPLSLTSESYFQSSAPQMPVAQPPVNSRSPAPRRTTSTSYPPVSQTFNTSQRHMVAQPSVDPWNTTHPTSHQPDYSNQPDSQQPIGSPSPALKLSSNIVSNSSGVESFFQPQSPVSKLRSQHHSANEKGTFQGSYYVSDGQIIFDPPLDFSRNGVSLPPPSMSENTRAVPDDMPVPPYNKSVQTPLEWVVDMDDKNVQTACGWGGGPTVNNPAGALQFCSASCPDSRNMGMRRKKRKRVCCDNCKTEMEKKKSSSKKLNERRKDEGLTDKSSGETNIVQQYVQPNKTITNEDVIIAELVKSVQAEYASKMPLENDVISFQSSHVENRPESNIEAQDVNEEVRHYSISEVLGTYEPNDNVAEERKK